MSEKLKIVSGVLQRQNKILLCYRKNTTFFPDHWAFPVGRLETGENFVDALRRELFEEIGIQMIDCESIMTLFDHQQDIEHQVFRITEWRGEAENLEPDLCEAIGWFSMENLPGPLTPATQTILNSF